MSAQDPDFAVSRVGDAERSSHEASVRRWWSSFGNLAVGEAAASLLRLGAVVWVARRLGPHNFGTVSAGLVVGGYLAVFAHSGLETIGTRDLATRVESASEQLGEIVAVRLMLAVVFYAAASAILLLAPVDRQTRLVVFGFALSVYTFAVDVRWSFIGIQRTRWVGAASATAAAFYLVIVVAAIQRSSDFVWIAPIQIASEALLAGILVLGSRRRFGPWRPRVRLARIRPLVLASLPITFIRSTRAMTISLDVVLVKLMLSGSSAGHYAAASRVTIVGIFYIGLYYYAYLPSVVHAWAESRGAVRRLLQLAVRRAFWFGLPLAVVATAAVPTLVRLALGPSYRGTSLLLQLLVWSLFLLGFGGAYASLLLAVNQQRLLARNAAVALVVNVAANLVLLPLVGVVGASVATIAAEGISLGLNYASARPFFSSSAIAAVA